MSQALLAIQNILQNWNIFNRLRETAIFAPFGDRKVRCFCPLQWVTLKLWMRIEQCTATDFQGWPKMTLKIKTVYFSIFRSGFWKILRQPYVELHGQDWNDKMEQIWQAVKINKLFSPARLASQVLYWGIRLKKHHLLIEGYCLLFI